MDGVRASGAFGAAIWGTTPWADSSPDSASFPAADAGERVVFLDGLISDAATLTTTGTAALTVANLQDMHPSRMWRSTINVDAILITLAQPWACNGVTLVGHNFTAAGVWRLRGATVQANLIGSPDVDTGWVSVWPNSVMPGDAEWPRWLSLLRWSNDAPMRYWRLDLADTGVGQAYLEAGRLMLGRYWQPAYNVDFDSDFAFLPADIQTASDFGGLYTERRGSPRGFDLKFSAMDWTDAQTRGHELHRRLGLARDLVCVLDPAEVESFHHFAIHGLISAPGSYRAVPAWNGARMVWATAIAIKELLW